MENIIVKKEKLLAKLKENMELHDEIYEEAYENYWSMVSKQFEDKVKDVRKKIKNKDFNESGVSINMRINAPQNNKDSYVQAIEMLEWTEQEEIELDTYQFERYVRNNWDWKDSFKASNSMYVGTGSLAKFAGF